jgi:hypothetical protein
MRHGSCRERAICNIPVLKAKMEVRVLKASEKGRPGPRVREIDFWPIVVEQGIRNTEDDRNAHLRLVRYARKHCTAEMVDFLFKNRHKLPSLIDDIWDWEQVDSRLAVADQTREELVRSASIKACVCAGQWTRNVTWVFRENGIRPEDVAHDVMLSIKLGRNPNTPVVTFVGFRGGEGKSFFFEPLASIFGEDEVQGCPEDGNYPLLGLEKKRVALLDDWSFNEEVLSFDCQLKWLEGKPVTITRPQNKDGYSGHLSYRGTAPIFVTTKESHMMPLEAAACLADEENTASHASMLLRRLKLYKFAQKMPKPRTPIKPCGSCLAKFLLRHDGIWRAAHAPAAM